MKTWKLPVSITIKGHISFRAENFDKALKQARKIQATQVALPEIQDVRWEYKADINGMEGEE